MLCGYMTTSWQNSPTPKSHPLTLEPKDIIPHFGKNLCSGFLNMLLQTAKQYFYLISLAGVIHKPSSLDHLHICRVQERCVSTTGVWSVLWGFCQALAVTGKHSCPAADSSKGTLCSYWMTACFCNLWGQVQAGCHRWIRVKKRSWEEGRHRRKWELKGGSLSFDCKGVQFNDLIIH